MTLPWIVIAGLITGALVVACVIGVQRWREHADSWLDRQESAPPSPAAGRAPLTTNQHILHLLLSVFTGGLWLPVWLVRAWRGNALPPL